MMASHKRRQYFVDPKVQGALLLRLVFYWAICISALSVLLVAWQVFTGPPRMFYAHFNAAWLQLGPAMIAAALLLPVVGIDLVRMTNRFVGPMYRLRREMRALADGQKIRPVHFRKGDFWQECADEFNKVAQRVIQAEQAAGANLSEPSEGQPSEPPAEPVAT